jgi:hypothetical protein
MNGWRKLQAVAVAVVLSSLGTLAQAHHSSAPYDTDKSVSVTGRLTKVSFRNPHGEIQLVVQDKDGKEQTWTAETAAGNLLRRRGWKPEQIAIGSVATLTGHPTKDGSRKMYLRKIQLADGTAFGDDESGNNNKKILD